MDFFNHQDQAVQRTKLLVLLFIGAVAALIVILNLFIAFLFVGVGEYDSLLDSVNGKQWFTITLIVVLGVGSASLFRWLQLLGGGKVVAESMGGELIARDTTDFYQKRLLNVVEEVALAAGMPVPPVYLLRTPTINAFAAGYRPSDAVIGITEGAIAKLSRDQLQGVVAHEFSHILNGDMRLNIRIMALLFGILFISLCGRFLLDLAARSGNRSSNNKDNSAAILLFLALGLIVIGYCGVFFGNLIKAAVSRQREFLADASAVQFTRNPSGIGGALKVIALEGSRIDGAATAEASHLFFGSVERPAVMQRLYSLFATHPSIDDRIQRIEPNWDGEYLRPQTRTQARQEAQASSLPHQMAAAVAVVGAALVDGVQANTPAKEQQDKEHLESIARDSGLAPVLIYALLLADENAECYPRQLEIIKKSPLVGNVKQVVSYANLVQKLAASEHLPLVDFAIPALKQMGKQSYHGWRQDIQYLIEADKQVSIFEWCLYWLISLYLDAHFVPKDTKHLNLLNERDVLYAIGIVISAVAHYGADNSEEAQLAFAAGCEASGFGGLQLRTTSSSSELSRALGKLRRAYPHVQGRLLKALKATVAYDQQIQPNELNLLRTIAAIIEMPMSYEEIFALVE